MNDQMGLFEQSTLESARPLAYRLRPDKLEGYVGQDDVINQLKSLDLNHPRHLIFWGPPGCGKTTLAKILATNSKLELYDFNAVLGGVNDLRKLIASAVEVSKMSGKKSIIFIDEIHRFNKAQQDALLPYLERGDFILFGATTEYPQTTLNKAILSRVKIIGLKSLATESVGTILLKAVENENLQIDSTIIEFIAEHSNGDARSALNNLENLMLNIKEIQGKDLEYIKKNFLDFQRQYDRNSSRHYDVISAFIKSVRGSDVNAALLWLAIMLDGGEDIEFIARRLIILASEDIGNADPIGLQMATSAHYAIKQIGMPEARIILAQATTYLAQAPKSNSSYLGIDSALEYIRSNPTIEVPTHLRNHHPDKKKYKYAHDYPNHWVEQDFVQEKDKQIFFRPGQIGYEKKLADYQQKIRS